LMPIEKRGVAMERIASERAERLLEEWMNKSDRTVY
jgi:hypothetical protein